MCRKTRCQCRVIMMTILISGFRLVEVAAPTVRRTTDMPNHNWPPRVGNRQPPYQPGCGSASASRGCYNHKRASDLIAAYGNLTTVQKSIPSAPIDPAHAPFGRHRVFITGDEPGDYGQWLTVGDANGPATQEVTAGTPDINGPATIDHNVYSTSATGSLDNRQCHKFGAQWVKVKKFWHGLFAFDSEQYQPNSVITWADGTDTIPSSAPAALSTIPDQTRYRTIAGEIEYDRKDNDGTVHSGGAARQVSVGRLNGISTVSGCSTTIIGGGPWTDEGDVTAELLANDGWNIKTAGDYILAKAAALSALESNTVVRTGDTWEVRFDGGPADGELYYVVTMDYAGGVIQLDKYSTMVGGSYFVAESEVFTFNDTNYTYYKNFNYNYDDGATSDGYRYQYTVTMDLSDAYTGEQFFADMVAGLAQWDMATHKEPFRSDAMLANCPLVVYDEVGPTVPDLGYASCLMDDYNDQLGGGLFGQITWHDPLDRYWLYDGTQIVQPGSWASATLVTGVRTGEIIAHLDIGQGRHFWFSFAHQTRISGPAWEIDYYGQDSQTPLPRTTLRWEDDYVQIYDGAVAGAQPGNFPQSWIRELGGVGEMVKYVEAKEMWRSVDFSRPHTRDKFAIDNPTACWIKSVDESDPDAIVFTVRKTQDAEVPGTADGINVGDKIIVTGPGSVTIGPTTPGIYEIVSITGPTSVEDYPGSGYYIDVYDVTVDTKIDDLPTDFAYGDARDDDDYLGALRWWSVAPGIAGRVACTVTEAAGTVTIVTSTAQPYLRTGAVVDVCDSVMTVLASSLTITRVGDSEFTGTHAAMPTAAYIVPHTLHDGSTPGTKYYFHENMGKRTFVSLTWTFSARAAEAGYPSPPTFYVVDGCLDLVAVQSCVPFTPCAPAIIGHVPGAGATTDDFENHALSAMPSSITFDSLFGTFSLQAVESTMPDPFWQTPFVPDGDVFLPGTVDWREDDGSGAADAPDGAGWIRYYAHHPLVEARSTVPATYGPGQNESPPALVSGVSLTYDLTVNDISPPYYSNGIPYGYDGIWRPYLLWDIVRQRSGGRFYDDYIEWVIW